MGKQVALANANTPIVSNESGAIFAGSIELAEMTGWIEMANLFPHI